MNPRSFTVSSLYRRNAQLFGNQTALLSAGSTITYGTLLDQVRRLAGALAGKGIGKGDRLALLSKNGPAFFTLIGAASFLGAVLVPINYRLTPKEIDLVLSDSRPKLFLYDQEFEGILSGLSAGPSETGERIPLDIGKIDPLPGEGKPVDPETVEDQDPLVMIHTAAIQGKPRGALISQGNLIAEAIQIAQVIGLNRQDNYLTILPMFHIFGLVMVLALMQAAGRNTVIAKFDPKEVVRIINREQVSIIGNFPPILTQILDEQGELGISPLKHVVGLEHPEIVQRFEKLGYGRFWLCYGQTETMGLTCLSENSERPGSAGRPGPLVDMDIFDEYDRPVQRGNPGEIVVRGPLVFLGYWQEEELTRQTLRGGWHHTGDLGRLDPEGFLWFQGRKAEKELIKPGGENVYPAEVEKTIMEHPAVEEVSVIGVPDPKFGEGIKAVCVLKPEAQVSEADLIAFVASRIASFKKPRKVAFVDALPRKTDGTIDREAIKARYGA